MTPKAQLTQAASSLVLALHIQLGLENDSRGAIAGAHKGPMETGTGKRTLLRGRHGGRGPQGQSAQAAGHRGGAGIGLSSKRRAESGTLGCRKSRLVRTGRGPGRGL